MNKTASKQAGPCADLEKVLGAAQGALVLAKENANGLHRIIDEDDLSEKDAANYAALDEAQDWVEQTERALKDCKESL